MPVYDYSSLEGKLISVFVPLDRPDIERQIQIQDGVEYRRVYAAPLPAIDTKIVEASQEEFRKITNKKGITNGELWSLSEEMAKRRKEKDGRDPVTEKFYRDFERKNGVKHTGEVREEKMRKAQEAQEKSLEMLRKAGYGR